MVKSVPHIVGGEMNCWFVVDAKQVAHGVAVFKPIEAPQGDPPRSGLLNAIKAGGGLLDPARQEGPLLVGRLGCLGRRHGLEREFLCDQGGQLWRFLDGRGAGQGLQAKIARGLTVAVAFETESYQERGHLLDERLLAFCGRRWLRSG